jgi:hypothetical protein
MTGMVQVVNDLRSWTQTQFFVFSATHVTNGKEQEAR